MRAGKFPLILFIGASLTGVGKPAALAVSPRAELSPDEFVAARQVALDMSDYVMSGMKDALAKQREPKTQAYSATTLNKWSKVLPLLFPNGTGPGAVKLQTAAKPAIWNDRGGFLRAAADYQQATAELIARANANDGPGFKEQLSRVNDACNACHGAYRVPEN